MYTVKMNTERNVKFMKVYKEDIIVMQLGEYSERHTLRSTHPFPFSCNSLPSIPLIRLND